MASGLIGGAESLPYEVGEWPAPSAKPFEQPFQPYAVLHVGASTLLKLWPPERWRALADGLRAQGLQIVWSGGQGEGAILDAIGMRDGEMNCIGALDLGQLWALLAQAKQLICPDTGIAHLARIVGVPTVALFGPGSSSIHGAGRFWLNVPFHIVTEADFPCRDQRVLFRRELDWVRRCGRSFGAGPGQCADPLCMQAITLARIEQELETLT
jgi:ADP-heptose:LPS heptosyltransferase